MSHCGNPLIAILFLVCILFIDLPYGDLSRKITRYDFNSTGVIEGRAMIHVELPDGRLFVVLEGSIAEDQSHMLFHRFSTDSDFIEWTGKLTMNGFPKIGLRLCKNHINDNSLISCIGRVLDYKGERQNAIWYFEINGYSGEIISSKAIYSSANNAKRVCNLSSNPSHPPPMNF